MKFTFKRNRKKSDVITATKNSLWQKFDDANTRWQYKCAHWLERKTSRFSRLNWIVILFSFIVFTSGCSIYLIATSFSKNSTKSIAIAPITKPINPISSGHETVTLNPAINKTEFEKIIRFRRYMDSLGRSSTGGKTHDSIVKYRPGLLDSLTILENYYYSHFKN